MERPVDYTIATDTCESKTDSGHADPNGRTRCAADVEPCPAPHACGGADAIDSELA